VYVNILHQMVKVYTAVAQSSPMFANKTRRHPTRDSDCSWDYSSAACGWQEHCEYRYKWGDLVLSHSCRIKGLEHDASGTSGGGTPGVGSPGKKVRVEVGDPAPAEDADCYWDYLRAGCVWPSRCEYRFALGDYLISHSCRLRLNVTNTSLTAVSSTASSTAQCHKEDESICAAGAGHPAVRRAENKPVPAEEHAASNEPEEGECRCQGGCVQPNGAGGGGACRYAARCPGAAQPFGAELGWWGRC